MKLKELLYALGVKPGPREYGFDIDTFQLPRDGEVSFARWRHPKERRKHLTQRAVDALREFLKPGDAAIDIGAHTGDSTLPIALAVGAAGSVFALEPNSYVYKILLANAALNRQRTNIFPLMFAATPRDGEFGFEYSDPGFCNGGLHEGISAWQHAHFFKLRVQGRNLLNYLHTAFPQAVPRIRFVKIDTEGFDPSVAESLQPLLKENRPFLRSEIYRHLPAGQRARYFRQLRELGYRIHKFNSDEDYVGKELAETDVMAWEHFDIFAVPG